MTDEDIQLLDTVLNKVFSKNVRVVRNDENSATIDYNLHVQCDYVQRKCKTLKGEVERLAEQYTVVLCDADGFENELGKFFSISEMIENVVKNYAQFETESILMQIATEQFAKDLANDPHVS